MTDLDKEKFEKYLRHFSYTDSYGNYSEVWKIYKSEDDMAKTNVKKSNLTWIAWVASFLVVVGLGWFGFQKYQKIETQKSVVKGETLLMTLVVGDVYVQKMGSDEWEEADVDEQLKMGDKVKTGVDSFCEIQMLNRAIFRVESSSEVLMKTLQNVDGKMQSRLKLAKGSLGVKPKKLQKGENFEVETRTAVAAVRGTKFSVKTDEKGNTEIAVVEGRVAVRPQIESLSSAEKKGQITKKASEILTKQIAEPVMIVPGEALKVNPNRVAMLNRALLRSIETISTQSGPITEEKLGITNGNEASGNDAFIKEIKRNLIEEVNTELKSSEQSETSNEVVKPSVVNLADLISQKEEISEDTRKDLDKISEAKILKKLDLIYRLNVNAGSDKAQIVLNDGQVVFGAVERKLEKGSLVKVSIRRLGFKDWSTNFTINSDVNLNVKLSPVSSENVSTNVTAPTNAMVISESNVVSEQVSSSSSTELAGASSSSEPEVRLPGKVEWKKALALNGNVSESVTFGNKVALTLGNELYILGLNGKILSKVTVVKDGFRLTRPTVYSGRIYMGSDNGGLYVYTTSGKLIWKSEKAGRQPYTGVYPIVKANKVIHASYDKGIQIFSLNGNLEKNFVSSDVIFSTPVLAQKNSVLIYGNNKGIISALQLSDGKQLWRKAAFEERLIYPLLTDGRRVVVLSRSTGTMKAFDVNDGKVLWTHTYVSLKRTKINPFVSGKVGVFVNSGGNGVLLVSMSGGSLLYQTKDVSVSTRPIVRGSWLYVGTSDGKIHGINFRNKQEWTYRASSAIRLLSHDKDNLYVMDSSQMVKLTR